VTTPMNDRLAARPLCPKRGIPIPAAQLVNPDGSANFAAIDGPKALHLAENRLCGVCSCDIGYWAAFLGGPRNAQHRSYLDPPMCLPCAAAVRLCPHIARQRVPRRPDGFTSEADVVTPHGFIEDKPTRWGLYITRTWTVHRSRHDATHATYRFEPAPAKTVRWFVYVNGRAVEQGRAA